MSDLVSPLEARGMRVSLAVATGAPLTLENEALAYRVAQEAIRNIIAPRRSGPSRSS